MAVEQAFADWAAVDPASGLGSNLYFVPDFGTPIVIEPDNPGPDGRFMLNRGAEFDLVSADLGTRSAGKASSYGDPNVKSVTLTSGTANYPAAVFSGADIFINVKNNTVSWDLNRFQNLLSHEIGHALGLDDVDIPGGGIDSLYYDDNFDGTSHATAFATLTNSFANLIDPFDPDNSPALTLYEPCNGDGNADSCVSSPGFDTNFVNIHMETSPQVLRDGPQNDDFAGRQFLYPFVAVPEPCSIGLLLLSLAVLSLKKR